MSLGGHPAAMLRGVSSLSRNRLSLVAVRVSQGSNLSHQHPWDSAVATVGLGRRADAFFAPNVFALRGLARSTSTNASEAAGVQRETQAQDEKNAKEAGAKTQFRPETSIADAVQMASTLLPTQAILGIIL
eukprot:3941201-Rhodomonas_salina.15